MTTAPRELSQEMIKEVLDSMPDLFGDLTQRSQPQLVRWYDRHFKTIRQVLNDALWQDISTAPAKGFFLVCCDDPKDDRPAMAVTGSFLIDARSPGQPEHLSLHHMTHWMPFPKSTKRTSL